jgi:adenosylhomocysteine nucleosidase
VLLAVTFALGGEFAAWRRLRTFQRCADRPVPVYEARIGAGRVRVVLTGIGHRAATAATATVFQDRPDICIASGLSGGLSPALQVADVIAAGRTRGSDGRAVDSDASLVALAAACGAKIVSTLYTSDTIVVSAAEKRIMSAMGDAVDMESAAVLDASRDRGIPAIAIRAISDPAGVDFPVDLNPALNGRGGFSLIRVMGALARRPHAVPGLVRLGVDGRRAASALAVFLDKYVERLT